jgi:3-mercaptopyruvate sulfurtransferase SseA
MDVPTQPGPRAGRTATGALLLLGGGSLLGVALNALSPHPISLLRPVYPTSASGPAACSSPEAVPAGSVGTMTQAEAVAACAACLAGFVDARGAAAFAHGHLPGAIHLPPVGHADEGSAIDPLRALGVVVVYDEGAGCALAHGVAERLVTLGLPDVRVLEGGWERWQADGSPAQSGACMQCEAPVEGEVSGS